MTDPIQSIHEIAAKVEAGERDALIKEIERLAADRLDLLDRLKRTEEHVYALKGELEGVKKLWRGTIEDNARLRRALRGLLQTIDASTYGEETLHHHTCPAPDHGKCSCGAYEALDAARKSDSLETGMKS